MATDDIKIVESKEKEEAEQMVGSAAAMLDELPEGVYVHKFSRPVQFEGETYTELRFDFNTLTGGDSLAVEEELRNQRHAIFVKSIDSEYLIRMCARACTPKVFHEIFTVMPVKDYNRITAVSQRFF